MMQTTVYVIDPNFRRRAQLAQVFRVRGFHTEICESFTELSEMKARRGYLFAADMPDLEGTSGNIVDELRQVEPALPFVLYAEQPILEKVVDSLRRGASDYLSWPLNMRLLNLSLKRLAGDGEPDVLKRRGDAARKVQTLSRRERQVLIHLLAGDKNKDMAAALGISDRTVEIHRSNLMRKLAAASAAQAVRIALDAGLDAEFTQERSSPDRVIPGEPIEDDAEES